ncbi:hypothetical protein BaRGS_00028007 [Batillaria attramentaria]|uniref:Uncharacterized protein n=1 Tax=Batillaria attramentaria TaxID=370345 RepID=A0ABD0K148_9CAEN
MACRNEAVRQSFRQNDNQYTGGKNRSSSDLTDFSAYLTIHLRSSVLMKRQSGSHDVVSVVQRSCPASGLNTTHEASHMTTVVASAVNTQKLQVNMFWVMWIERNQTNHIKV